MTDWQMRFHKALEKVNVPDFIDDWALIQLTFRDWGVTLSISGDAGKTYIANLELRRSWSKYLEISDEDLVAEMQKIVTAFRWISSTMDGYPL